MVIRERRNFNHDLYETKRLYLVLTRQDWTELIREAGRLSCGLSAYIDGTLIARAAELRQLRKQDQDLARNEDRVRNGEESW